MMVRQTSAGGWPGSARASTRKRGRWKSACSLDNSACELRDRTFGAGRIIVLREEPHALVVPVEAVQSTGDANFVFVRTRDYLAADAPKVFYPFARCASAPATASASSCWPACFRAKWWPPRAARCCWPNCSEAIWAPVADVTQHYRNAGEADMDILNRIIGFSLRQPAAGDPGHAGGRGRRRALPGPARYRCLSRHHAGAGADQHRGAGAWRRKKSSGRSRFRSSRRSADCRAWSNLRSISKFGLSQVVVTVRRRHRHLFRPAADQRAAGDGRTAAAASAGRRWGRWPPAWAKCSITSLPGRGTTSTDLRTIHDWVIKPPTAHRARHGRDQQLGRLRKAVSGPHRSRPADQVRPDVRPGRARPSRRTISTSAAAASAQDSGMLLVQGLGRTTSIERSATSSSPPATACRSASATWPRWRSATRSAAAPSRPTARAKSCWAWASC